MTGIHKCATYFQIFKPPVLKLFYSVLKLFTGFDNAAFIAWKLTVSKAIVIAKMPATIKIHRLILIR